MKLNVWGCAEILPLQKPFVFFPKGLDCENVKQGREYQAEKYPDSLEELFALQNITD